MDDFDLLRRLNAIAQDMALLDRKVDFLFKHLGVAFVDTRPPPDDIERLLLAGDALSATKLYQQTHSVHLAEAKRAIDAIKAKLGV